MMSPELRRRLDELSPGERSILLHRVAEEHPQAVILQLGRMTRKQDITVSSWTLRGAPEESAGEAGPSAAMG